MEPAAVIPVLNKRNIIFIKRSTFFSILFQHHSVLSPVLPRFSSQTHEFALQ